MTAPFDPRALDAVTQSLETTCVVTATTAAGVPIEVLDVSSLVLTMDEGWAPLAQAEMTLTSTNPAALDPRTGAKITLELGYRYPGGTLDQHQVADLTLTSWTGTDPEGVIHVNAAGDEARLLEWVPLGAPVTYPVGSAIVTIIAELLAASIARTPVVTATLDAVLSEPLTIGPGTRLWAVIKSISDQADVWTYADPLGVWHVTPRPTTASLPVAQVTTGPAGIVTGIETGLSRTEWGNTVELEYAQGQFAYAHQAEGPMGTDEVGVCVVPVRVDAPWPGTTAAKLAAASILRRTLTRGKAQALTGLAAWWVRPGDTITTPDQTRAIVAQVRFTYPDSLMTITTRTPEEA